MLSSPPLFLLGEPTAGVSMGEAGVHSGDCTDFRAVGLQVRFLGEGDVILNDMTAVAFSGVFSDLSDSSLKSKLTTWVSPFPACLGLGSS